MDLKQMRDTFAKITEILDRMITLEERSKNGENVEAEYEDEAGKLMIQMMKLEAIK